MKNYIERGEVITATPSAAVSAGVGYLFGAALFGVTVGDVAANTAGEFLTEGVIELGKTSALAIAVGDRLFWDPTNKVVNKTAPSQVCIGVAVSAAANPSATVNVRLGGVTPSGT